MTSIASKVRSVNEALNNSNEEQAIDFLQALRPDGPWVLTAIVPDGVVTTTTVHTEMEARDFIKRYNGRRNLYYTVNITKQAMEKKPRKDDIATVEYLHADLDPRDDEEPTEARLRYRQAIKEHSPRPSIVVNSGNGLNVLWRLKTPISDRSRFADIESRNLALVQMLGGTAGTQNVDRILRLPGTTNLPNAVKRRAGRGECRAKLIVTRDVEHRLKDFPVPDKQPTAAMGKKRPDASVDLPASIRALLYLTTTAGYATRSELLASLLYHAVRRKGLSDETIVAACLDPNPGGVICKHCEQKGGRPYVLRQIKKARQKVLAGDDETRPLILRRVDQFKPRKLKWLWWPFIPRGMITTIMGDGEVGKSTLALDIAARITKGQPWPCFDANDEVECAPLGSVIILCKEDDFSLIVRPRLEAAGADLSRVHTVGYEVADDAEQFDPIERLDTTVDDLEQKIAHIGDVRMILIDPITDFVGNIDMYKDNQVRTLLNPLARLASRRDLVALLILHLNKKTDQAARYRGMGSVAFRNVSKSTLLVAHGKDGADSRLMAQEKKNLTKQQRTVSFTLHTVPRNPFPRVEWGDDWQQLDVNDLLDAKTTKQQRATQLLQQWLARGPRRMIEIEELAKKHDISDATLKLAAKKLVHSRKEGGNRGKWMWELR